MTHEQRMKLAGELTTQRRLHEHTRDHARRELAHSESELERLNDEFMRFIVNASAIEARSDATTQIGAAEGESAAPSGETPALSQPSSVATDEGVVERDVAAIAWLMGAADSDAKHAAMLLRLGRDEDHYGDCTKAPITCQRCVCDEALAAADQVRAAIQEGVGEHE